VITVNKVLIAVYLFLKGLLVGLSIAAPVGPIGILCINRTLSSGLMVGLVSGLGAALADAIYGCIAGFGLVAVSSFLLSQQVVIRLVGGAFLFYLGVNTFLATPKNIATADKATTLWQDFSSIFLLTLTNPATILSFIAIYSGLGIVDNDASYNEALILILGVFLGSLSWWFVLCSSISLIRHKLNQTLLTAINRFSGFILIGFGIVAIIGGWVAKGAV
jgi:threonine/homoserine/homoserine lactone efflux protein